MAMVFTRPMRSPRTPNNTPPAAHPSMSTEVAHPACCATAASLACPPSSSRTACLRARLNNCCAMRSNIQAKEQTSRTNHW